MTQAELDYAVAEATGESLQTIADLGFVLLRRGPFEREPSTAYDDLDADYPDGLTVGGADIFAFPARYPHQQSAA